MTFGVAGKVVVVTGAHHPYGKAAATRLAAAGAQVVAVDRAGIGSVAELERVQYRRADPADEAQMREVLAGAARELGRLDAVVCNAGSEAAAGESLLSDLDAAAFARDVRDNTLSVLWVLKHAPPLMRDGGSIVTLAAQTALTGAATLGGYAAAKAAVLALSKTAALELAAARVRVNCVVLGPFDTPYLGDGQPEAEIARRLNPLGRMAEPDEVAALFHYLIADESAYLTGAAIDFAGGASAGAAAPNVVDALLAAIGTIGPFDE